MRGSAIGIWIVVCLIPRPASSSGWVGCFVGVDAASAAPFINIRSAGLSTTARVVVLVEGDLEVLGDVPDLPAKEPSTVKIDSRCGTDTTERSIKVLFPEFGPSATCKFRYKCDAQRRQNFSGPVP